MIDCVFSLNVCVVVCLLLTWLVSLLMATFCVLRCFILLVACFDSGLFCCCSYLVLGFLWFAIVCFLLFTYLVVCCGFGFLTPDITCWLCDCFN